MSADNLQSPSDLDLARFFDEIMIPHVVKSSVEVPAFDRVDIVMLGVVAIGAMDDTNRDGLNFSVVYCQRSSPPVC